MLSKVGTILLAEQQRKVIVINILHSSLQRQFERDRTVLFSPNWIINLEEPATCGVAVSI